MIPVESSAIFGLEEHTALPTCVYPVFSIIFMNHFVSFHKSVTKRVNAIITQSCSM